MNQSIKPVLLVLIGFPASGKSTLAKQCKKFFENPLNYQNQEDRDSNQKFDNIHILDIDKIRGEHFGSVFNPKNEVTVQKLFLNKIQIKLTSNNMVIVDDLNYYESRRHEYLKLEEEYNLIRISIWVNFSLQMCINNNHERGTPISDSVIETVASRFDIPGKKYRWDQPDFTISHYPISNSFFIDIWDLIKTKNSDTHKKSSIPQSNSSESLDQAVRKIIHAIINSSEISEENLDKQAIAMQKKDFLRWLVKNQIHHPKQEDFIIFLKDRFASNF